MARKHRILTLSLAIGAAGVVGVSLQIASAKPVETPSALWVTGYDYISEFHGMALKQSGKTVPNLEFGNKSLFNPESIAFDSDQNLWIAYEGTAKGPPVVIEISRGKLASLSGNSVNVKVKLRSKKNTDVPFVLPRSLAFDAADDLWVSDPGRNGVMELLPDQIKHSGAPTPTILISASNFIPQVIRFDTSDNLWVDEFQSTNPQQIWQFAPAARAASGTPNPGLVVNLPDGITPVDFAFDSSGDLWLAGSSFSVDTLEMIAADDLSGTGEISPSAAVTITSPAFGTLIGTGSCLGGIDFDVSGDLWVSVGANNPNCDADTQIVEFTPGQLSSGGSLTPSLTINQNGAETNLYLPGPVRFGPKP